MSRKLLTATVAALVLALGVWLVPTAFGGGSATSTRATTVAASAAPSPTSPSPGTGCTHAPATSVQ
jgi:hypothetical protein